LHSSRPILIALSFLLAASTPAFAQVVNDPTLAVDFVVGNLASPVSMAFYGPGDFLVIEKDAGRVVNVVDGVRQPGWALDLAVHSGPERGLLGIAVHPNFPQTPRVYLYYTPSATGVDTSVGNPLPSRVERYTFANGTLSNPQLILTVNAPVDTPAHLGGPLAFGPDKKLYLIVGDRQQEGGLQNVPPLTVADDTGVIFRINEDGSAPGDNPLSAPGFNLSKYYAYGIRNSFGIAFDPATGVLWESENGPESYDELNRVAPGFNSGWLVLMGPDSRDPDGTAQLTQLAGGQYSDPEFSWNETVVPTALAFLRGSALGPAYDDSLVVGSYGGTIFRFRINAAGTGIIPPNAGLSDLVSDFGDDTSAIDFVTGLNGVTDLKVGPDGDLYGVTILNNYVFRIRSTVPPPDTDGDGIYDGHDNCPTVANPNQEDGGIGPVQFESPADGVGDACDNCVNVSNPRVSSSFLASNPWATLTGGQRDDDHDGYGNKCDADFTPTGALVGSADLAQFRASAGKSRVLDICGTSGSDPCAKFDLDESGALIGSADLTIYRARSGKASGPRCAACTGTGSVPLPCTAGTSGSCF
jgi:glucose/arabinose dehydrogenase